MTDCKPSRGLTRTSSALVLALVSGWALVGIGAGQAQTLPPSVVDNAARQAEALQREQQLRAQEQQNQDAASKRPPTELQAPEPAAPSIADTGQCRTITAIQLLEARKFPAADQDRILKPYLGKCLRAEDVGALLSAVTKFYIDHGYSTTRAYIPGQDLSGGRLQILIVEGKVSALKLKGAGVLLAGAFPGVVGRDLNLRDFEQGLDQINRLLSNHATLDIQPGDKPGDSVVVIDNVPTSPLHFAVSYDDYGVRATGQNEGSFTVSLDDPLHLNDYFSYTRTQSYLGRRSPDASDANNFLYSVPYGYWTLSAGGLTSDYHERIISPTQQVIDLSGDAETAYLRVERMIYRDHYTRITAGADLTAKLFTNDLDGERLITSSRDLTVADFTLTATRNLPAGLVTANIGFSQGLKLFHALHDASDLPDEAPRAQYRKLTFGAFYQTSWAAWGRTASVSSQFAGQYSFDTLYATEQFSIGGPFTVRGFYDSFFADDNGGFVQNTLSITQPLPQVAHLPASIRPYAGLDAGFVSGNAHDTPEGTLVSAALGFAVNVSVLSVDVFVGHPIAAPSIAHQYGFNPFARVSLAF